AAAQACAAGEATREEAERARTAGDREAAEARETERRASWLIEERRGAPQQGAAALRRAQLEGELAAEQRVAERAARERAERAAAIDLLTTQVAQDSALIPQVERLEGVLVESLAAVAERAVILRTELEEDR